MRMQVRAQGDEVHIELNGVAGRQQRVLQALNACQSEVQKDQGSSSSNPDEVRVRAGSNTMRIRLCGHNGRRYDADTVYRRLRHLLIEHRDVVVV